MLDHQNKWRQKIHIVKITIYKIGKETTNELKKGGQKCISFKHKFIIRYYKPASLLPTFISCCHKRIQL